ncbi:WD40-repeat-containing domain protein [Trametes elegans]|nr:WD40-repeat-containing domain protein [Trametes elegans]
MPHFFAGDELGAIKSISYAYGDTPKEWKATSTVLVPGPSDCGHSKTVQKLAVHASGPNTLLSAARADGSASLYQVQQANNLSVVHEWSETRLKQGQRFVGLSTTEKGVYSCTSNGALRLTKPGQEGAEPSSSSATLPMRLCEWRLSSDEQTFAYGGDEVELSLWDTGRAFSQPTSVPPQPPSEIKKRKRGDQLLPGELWRAKNVPNNHLSLRQPVHNTALTYLQPSSSASHQHLLVGTANGNVRRYDTRAARRPVADWKGVGKTGGVSTVEKGPHEHEVFVADRGCTLAAVDLRNGKIVYSYKGLAGAVTSVAPTRSLMVSAAQDRFVRLHSIFAPPAEVGQQQEHKGEVLDKLYMKVTPTVVVWDGKTDVIDVVEKDDDAVGEDEVWDAMEEAESDSEAEGKPRRKEKRSRTT